MLTIRDIALGLVMLIMTGCATTSVVTHHKPAKHRPSTTANILSAPPARPYETIAILEAMGPINTPLADLLGSMRKKAKEMGADAILPAKGASQQNPPGLIYNPWPGGYQIMLAVFAATFLIVAFTIVKLQARKKTAKEQYEEWEKENPELAEFAKEFNEKHMPRTWREKLRRRIR